MQLNNIDAQSSTRNFHFQVLSRNEEKQNTNFRVELEMLAIFFINLPSKFFVTFYVHCRHVIRENKKINKSITEVRKAIRNIDIS